MEHFHFDEEDGFWPYDIFHEKWLPSLGNFDILLKHGNILVFSQSLSLKLNIFQSGGWGGGGRQRGAGGGRGKQSVIFPAALLRNFLLAAGTEFSIQRCWHSSKLNESFLLPQIFFLQLFGLTYREFCPYRKGLIHFLFSSMVFVASNAIGL